MNIQLPIDYIPTEDMNVTIHELEKNIEIKDEQGVTYGHLPKDEFTDVSGYLFERRDFFRAILTTDGELKVVRYTPLHAHSGYSMLDGASKTEDMANKAEYAMALTDHGNMFGTFDFYTKMIKAGKKPIIGVEAYSETIDGEKDGNHLVLLAENEEGYKNIVKLVSKSNENRKGRHGYVSYDMMREHSEGVLATSSCLGGEIPQAIMRGQDDQAIRVAKEMQSIFGKDNYFIEIQRHGLPEEKVVNPILIDMSRKLDAKLIATSDSHYTNKEDREGQEILMCLSTNDTMDNPNRFRLIGEGYHIHTSEEMVELFKDIPEALENTIEIAERCNVSLGTDENYMPHFPLPEGFDTEDEYFEWLVWQGFEERFKGTDAFDSEEYRERLRFEMDTITSMGFPGYFIITWDVINFANENGILVGPGRGSACGSLVSYVLQITDVDPIPYGLLFERFLNPDRYSMPDIDIDFPNTRREEIIEYTRGKYGENSVARIVTYSTLSAKRVVRDVTKAMGYDYADGSKIADAIPNKPGISLNDSFIESAEFNRLYKDDKKSKRIIDMALQLEGLPRNTSMHACGVIISAKPVNEFVPTFYAKNTDTGTYQLTTQFDKDQVEDMGLLKMDFLGLKTLGVIEESLELINEKQEDDKCPLTMRTIPVDDTETYQNLLKGNTSGVFQLEGPGMTNAVTQIMDGIQHETEPTSQEALLRLIAVLSLYRPGPMDEIPNFIKNMKKPESVHYETDDMKRVLSETHGVIVYQEQVMQLVRDLAGFSRGQSDILRKGMGDQIPEIMDDWGDAFLYGSDELNVKGAVPNGIPEEVAIDIWHKMVRFSDYAFNKSHAAGYSFVSARTGWLATHYPTEFYTAMMNIYVTEKDKAQKYLATSKGLGIDILQPSVNQSMEHFSVDGKNIRFGLNGISHVGKTAGYIIKEREKNGKFTNMRDFVVRMVTNYSLSTKALTHLILTGGLDEFPGTRLEKTEQVNNLLELGKFIRDSKESNRPTLIDIDGVLEQDIFNPSFANERELEHELLLAKEREIAGFYITGHPLTEYEDVIDLDNHFKLSTVIGHIEEEIERSGDTFDTRKKRVENIPRYLSITGVITEVTTHYTKTGDPLKVLSFEDDTGTTECIVFASTIQENRGLFEENNLLLLEGHIKVDDGDITFVVGSAEDLHSFKEDSHPKHFQITGHRNVYEARKQYKGIKAWSKSIKEWEENLPEIPIVFIQDGNEHDMNVSVPYSRENIQAIRQIVGTSSLKPIYH